MNTAPEQKGVNFKQTPTGQLMLVNKKSFFEYIDSLPENERGWIELRFEPYKKLSKRGLFANVHPIKK